ncbi:MAG: hypothetical protein ACAI43_05465, partial [Phycisphaerae bacterium]
MKLQYGIRSGGADVVSQRFCGSRRLVAAVAAAVAGLVTLPDASTARAATIIKGDSATLANAGDWVGSTAPGA